MTLIKESVMYVNVLEYFRNMSLFNDQDANCRIKRPIAKSKWKHASTAIVSRLWTFIIVFYFYFSFSLFAFGLRIICFLFLQYDVFLWLCANWVQKNNNLKLVYCFPTKLSIYCTEWWYVLEFNIRWRQMNHHIWHHHWHYCCSPCE